MISGRFGKCSFEYSKKENCLYIYVGENYIHTHEVDALIEQFNGSPDTVELSDLWIDYDNGKIRVDSGACDPSGPQSTRWVKKCNYDDWRNMVSALLDQIVLPTILCN